MLERTTQLGQVSVNDRAKQQPCGDSQLLRNSPATASQQGGQEMQAYQHQCPEWGLSSTDTLFSWCVHRQSAKTLPMEAAAKGVSSMQALCTAGVCTGNQQRPGRWRQQPKACPQCRHFAQLVCAQAISRDLADGGSSQRRILKAGRAGIPIRLLLAKETGTSSMCGLATSALAQTNVSVCWKWQDSRPGRWTQQPRAHPQRRPPWNASLAPPLPQ